MSITGLDERILLFGKKRVKFAEVWPINAEKVEDEIKQLNGHVPQNVVANISQATGQFTMLTRRLPELYSIIYENYDVDKNTWNKRIVSRDVRVVYFDPFTREIHFTIFLPSTIITPNALPEPDTKLNTAKTQVDYKAWGLGFFEGAYVEIDEFEDTDGVAGAIATDKEFTLTGTPKVGTQAIIVRINNDKLDADTYSLEAGKLVIDTTKEAIPAGATISVAYVDSKTTL